MIDHKASYRKDLQGLRAIAILLVILAHSDLDIVTGGFIGVDIFFVLSGFLITGLLLNEYNEAGSINYVRFYSRRLKRLLPALIVMLCVSVILAVCLLSGVEASKQLASAPYAASWTSNLYFVFTTVNYFDELAGRDLFLHTWSLGVEEQFYLIWPILISILLLSGKEKFSQDISKHRILPEGLCAVFIISLILNFYWTKYSPQMAFYLMPSRIWQFSLGAGVFLLVMNNRNTLDNQKAGQDFITASLLLYIGLIFIIGSAIFLGPTISYPGYWALIPSLATGLVIFAGNSIGNEKINILNHPALVWLGDRSYSLYLWHWPIYMLGFSMGFQGLPAPTLGMISFSLLATILSYRFIELPFWKGRWSHLAPGRTILLSILLMLIVIFSLNYLQRQLPTSETTTDISFKFRFDVPEIYFHDCDAWYEHARVEPCLFGNEAAENNVVLLGDSIGAQWFSLIPEIFDQTLWQTTVYTKSSCPMVDVDYFYPRIGKIYEICKDWRNDVIDELEMIKPDVIVMGSSATYEFNEIQWIEGSSRILARISNSANTVIIIAGTPSLGLDGPGCVARNISEDGAVNRTACSTSGRLEKIKPVASYLEQVANRYANVNLLNMNDLICPNEICNAITEDGVVVFRDSQHLTDTFVKSSAPSIRQRIERFYSGLQ